MSLFRSIDRTSPLLSGSGVANPSVLCVVQPGLCRTRSDTPKTGLLVTWPIMSVHYDEYMYDVLGCVTLRLVHIEHAHALEEQTLVLQCRNSKCEIQR